MEVVAIRMTPMTMLHVHGTQPHATCTHARVCKRASQQWTRRKLSYACAVERRSNGPFCRRGRAHASTRRGLRGVAADHNGNHSGGDGAERAQAAAGVRKSDEILGLQLADGLLPHAGVPAKPGVPECKLQGCADVLEAEGCAAGRGLGACGRQRGGRGGEGGR